MDLAGCPHRPAPSLPSRMAAVCMILASSILPWAFAWDAPLCLDDRMGVMESPVVNGSFSPSRIFSTNSWGSPEAFRHTPNYRPLSVSTLAITRAMFDLRPSPYRAFNAMVIATVGVLLLLILLRLGVSLLPSLAGAGWFAIHPVHVEVGMFAVNREEALAAMFTLWFLARLLDWTSLGIPAADRSGPGRVPLRVLEWFLLSLAALLSKETGIVTVGLALLVPLLWPHRGLPWPRRWLPAGAALLALGIYLPLRLAALGHLGASFIPPQDNPLAVLGWGERLPAALGLLSTALELLLWPARLSVDWSGSVLPIVTWTDPRSWLGLAIGVLAFGGMALARRRRPALALGLLLAVLAWAPSSHLLFPSSILFAERLLFLPGAGFAMALAGALEGPFGPSSSRTLRTILLAMMVGIFGVMGLRTAARALDFSSCASLYAASLEARPGSPRLWVNLGVEWFRSGRTPQAEAAFRKALSLDPEDAEAHLGLGRVMARSGKAREAEASFREALRIRPGFPVARANLCLLLVSLQRDEEALPFCEDACRQGLVVREVLNHLETRGQCLHRPGFPEDLRD